MIDAAHPEGQRAEYARRTRGVPDAPVDITGRLTEHRMRCERCKCHQKCPAEQRIKQDARERDAYQISGRFG